MNEKIILEPDAILKQADQSSRNLAQTEAENFSEAKLDQEAKTNEHKRQQYAKTVIHFGNIVLIAILYIGIISGVFVFIWHLVLPKQYHFLTYEQLEIIKTLLFSALATNFAKEFLRKINN